MKGKREKFYCGCCGRPCGESDMWCMECEAHVAKTSAPPWDRTYSAVHKQPCPFEEKP